MGWLIYLMTQTASLRRFTHLYRHVFVSGKKFFVCLFHSGTWERRYLELVVFKTNVHTLIFMHFPLRRKFIFDGRHKLNENNSYIDS